MCASVCQHKNKPTHAWKFWPSPTSFLLSKTGNTQESCKVNHHSSFPCFSIFCSLARLKNNNWFNYIYLTGGDCADLDRTKWDQTVDTEVFTPTQHHSHSSAPRFIRGLKKRTFSGYQSEIWVVSKDLLVVKRIKFGKPASRSHSLWLCWVSAAPTISGIMETMDDVGVNGLWTLEQTVSFCLLSVESTESAILGCSFPRIMGLLKYSVLLVRGQLSMFSSSCK